MRRTRHSLLLVPLAAVLLAACSGSAPSPSPEPTPPPEAKTLLRVTMQQALPPPSTFGWLPSLVITLDGRVLSGGAVPAIFPGPLVQPVIERRITPAGWARIVAAARAAGLLGGARDFTGGGVAPGGMTARLEIVADGKVFDLTGDPNRIMVCVTTPCDPQPGSPEAFGSFLSRLTELVSLVGEGNLGKEGVYVATGYALIVGSPPDDQGLAQPPMAWPLAAGFAAFGKPLANGSGDRCGTITGTDADSIRAALGQATQITKFRDPVDGSFHGLIVRPLLPGDGDPCEGLV
ncbi:MAG TPA: hypothetical protein VIF63_05145 [Candidatus Limnocylindrales bacterium]|jgi:hypothetical protein